MGKKLRIRDRVLIGLALAGDFLVPATLRAMRGLPPEQAYWWTSPGYKKKNFYTLIGRLLKTGAIEKIVKDGKPFLRLADKNLQFRRDFSLFALRDKGWDGKWRLVIFDIAEKKRGIRDSLREKLYRLGFGRLQKSIYISPYDFVRDLAEFFATQGLLGQVFVLTAKHELMGDPKELAKEVWHLQDLNGEYEKILEILEEAAKIADMEKRIKKLQKAKSDFAEVLFNDPLLPKQLLPSDWVGDRVAQIIKKVHI